jgi:hypothetical protein
VGVLPQAMVDVVGNHLAAGHSSQYQKGEGVRTP